MRTDCFWFFHDWGKWSSVGRMGHNDGVQYRRCKTCGLVKVQFHFGIFSYAWGFPKDAEGLATPTPTGGNVSYDPKTILKPV